MTEDSQNTYGFSKENPNITWEIMNIAPSATPRKNENFCLKDKIIIFTIQEENKLKQRS